MTKRFLTLLLGVAVFLFIALPASAQNTCDLCGYCQKASKPANWDACAKCIYPGVTDPNIALSKKPNENKAYTVFGCVETTAGGFSSFFMRFISTVVSGIAFLGIIYGGLKVITARGDKEAVTEGKRYVYGSILGLLLVLFSVFIIRTIGGTILKLPFIQ
jgi:hypothetical protein